MSKRARGRLTSARPVAGRNVTSEREGEGSHVFNIRLQGPVITRGDENGCAQASEGLCGELCAIPFSNTKQNPRGGSTESLKMAPVKIKHIVSFTSQDPKYPVENLLLEESLCPWLSCPRDRSRQLKAELQLEQASHIGYVDIGNCGSAFLQIEVGRSAWPLDQNYFTLLPTTTLMMPADAKRDKNRSGVRMFKEGDFLASTLGEKWDRIRLVCSQPFNRHAQFGLSFIRIRTPLDGDCSRAELASSLTQGKRWGSSGSFKGAALLLAALDRSTPPTKRDLGRRFCGGPLREPLDLSLQEHRGGSGAEKPTAAAGSSLQPRGTEHSLDEPPSQDGAAGGLCPQKSPPLHGTRCHSCHRRQKGEGTGLAGCRPHAGPFSVGSIAASSTRPQDGSQRTRRGQSRSRRLQKTEEEEENVAVGLCPICAGRFPASLLPAHASSCGEDSYEASPPSSSSSASWEHAPEAWVHCPLCQLPFPAVEVEGHASTCGEEAEPSVGSPSWLWAD
ncbi:hypothetical protein lerEdw1_005818 [Lerista edwardsae]|nr:hypothetical protein lerEdw1_005818 [Lerista edwardsae]